MEYSRYEVPGWHAREQAPESNPASPITWLLVGMGIGAGIALLFAPTSGRELRCAIGHGCQSTLNGISRGTRELRQRGANLLNFRRWRSVEKIQQG